MEKKYNAELNFKNTTIDLYEVTKEQILLVLKRQVEEAHEILISIKYEVIK